MQIHLSLLGTVGFVCADALVSSNSPSITSVTTAKSTRLIIFIPFEFDWTRSLLKKINNEYFYLNCDTCYHHHSTFLIYFCACTQKGKPRHKKVLHVRSAPLQVILDRITASADAFVAGAPQHDDRTLIVLSAL